MIFASSAYDTYCSVVRITSKEHEQPIPLTPWGTQRHLRREIAKGLERDVHEFVCLKGVRQAGGSTECWTLAAFWHQYHQAIQGAIVTESAENMIYARDVVREIIDSAPSEYRRAKLVDNPVMLRFENRSRLMFLHATRQKGGLQGQLGRSRGVNFLAATEIGSWTDDKGVKSMRATLSKEHPLRIAIWESTAIGHGVWYEMCQTAMRAVGQRFIFLGWWLREGYEIDPDGDAVQREAWRAYGSTPPSSEEARLIREVKTRYDVDVRQTQLAWWRWQHREAFHGDDAMMNQEYGWLPEECFQSFGKKFIPEPVMRQVRADVLNAPSLSGYRFEWGHTFDERGDETIQPVEPEEHPPLRVWEEPDAGEPATAGHPGRPYGVYVVAAHPPFSSDPDESDAVIQVYRAWPDQLTQVAEYFAEDDSAYKFTWSILALCMAYSNKPGPYLVYDITQSGTAVLEEHQHLVNHGYGLSTAFRSKYPRVQDFLGNTRDFLYHRPDALSRALALQWKGSSTLRPWIMNQFRDTIERGQFIVRSEGLRDELQALRQGEHDDNDDIGASGIEGSARVMTAALAVHHWRQWAVPELSPMMLPKEPDKHTPQNATEMVVQGFFGNLLARAGR